MYTNLKLVWKFKLYNAGDSHDVCLAADRAAAQLPQDNRDDQGLRQASLSWPE